MKRARTTLLLRSSEHCFLLRLDNGGLRYVIGGLGSIDRPDREIPEFATEEDFEEFVSQQFRCNNQPVSVRL